MPTKIGRTFPGECEQFWPDAFPAATDDFGNRGVEPELGCKSVALTIEPWLLLNNA